MRCSTVLLLSIGLACAAGAGELVTLDPAGVIRWRADQREVALFGANYCLPSASDFRAAGYVGADRHRLIEQDMAHFARMGWDGMRLGFWGDWENSDPAGNLIANEHLDLLDYLVFQAKRRGIFMLFTPIHTHSALWPDGQDGPDVRGFSKHFPRDAMGRDPAAIQAQRNYLRQVLEHVNPYTGVALKDEPAIVFIELINEPWHHADDVAGSVAYINALVDAVRGTGCEKILFHNLSQDFAMARPIRESQAQGVSFGWYPTGLLARRTLSDNFLRWADEYPPMHDPQIASLPRIVYEFDAADTLSPAMYPAMVRTFRGVGVQFAAMFAYDMLATAPYNLGWQTHYLNLVYTPRKAVGAIIAAEAMRHLPRGATFGPYPENRHFGAFHVAPDDGGRAWMVTQDTVMHAGDCFEPGLEAAKPSRVVGTGSSPWVNYEGTGAYFLERVEPGMWRLELYPDAVLVQDPFAQRLNHEKVTSRLIWRGWPMRVRLPDLGSAFSVLPVNAGNAHRTQAADGQFEARPGVFLLEREGRVDPATAAGAALPDRLPAMLGRVGFSEFVCPPPQSLALQIVPRIPDEDLGGERAQQWDADVVGDELPDRVELHLRRAGESAWHVQPMTRMSAYRYRADVNLPAGEALWYITASQGTTTVRYPSNAPAVSRARIVAARAPLTLLKPARDFPRFYHPRLEGQGRESPLSLVRAPAAPHGLVRLSGSGVLVRAGWSVTAALAARGRDVEELPVLRVRARIAKPGCALRVVLIEEDGTSWSASVPLGPKMAEHTIPLVGLAAGGGEKLPVGYPGVWNVDLPPAADRGRTGDRVHIGKVQQVQVVLDGTGAVELEALTLAAE